MNSNEEIKLLYLLSGSYDILPPSCVKLRSYFNTHLSNIADQHNLQLLKNFRNRNKTCPYCYSSWSGNTTSFKLLPSKKFRTPQTQRKVIENGKSQTGQLNESRNTLVLKCQVCSKKSAFSLIKRKPVEENRKEDDIKKVISIKKKKKKRDRSCGLAVNLIKPESNFPEIIIVKKKKRVQGTEGTATANLQGTQSGTSKHTPISKNTSNPEHSLNIQAQKNLVSSSSKNFLPNPFAAQIQWKSSKKKKDKKLERLKQAVKEEKNMAKKTKKTLKDFLTLI